MQLECILHADNSYLFAPGISSAHQCYDPSLSILALVYHLSVKSGTLLCLLRHHLNFLLLRRMVMQGISSDSRVVSFVARPGIKTLLLTVLEQLQRCQKALNEFLEVRLA